MAWIIYNHSKITVEDQVTLDLRNLMVVKLQGDNLFAFMNDGEQCLAGLAKNP